MKIILLLAVLFSGFTYFATEDDITGIWQITLPNNITGTINYRKDSTFVTTVNKKIFTSGKYTYKDNTVTFVEDSGCQDKSGGYLKGIYKINFFAADSIQFALVYDSCAPRKKDLSQLKLGRVEKSTSK